MKASSHVESDVTAVVFRKWAVTQGQLPPEATPGQWHAPNQSATHDATQKQNTTNGSTWSIANLDGQGTNTTIVGIHHIKGSINSGVPEQR
jgi:hypothetical protein